jgi:hypothetical protein
VLGQTQHRGARVWVFDVAELRVMPVCWDERELPPTFTDFEAWTLPAVSAGSSALLGRISYGDDANMIGSLVNIRIMPLAESLSGNTLFFSTST